MLTFSPNFSSVSGIVLALCVVAILGAGTGCGNKNIAVVSSQEPLAHTAYIWQRQWSADLEAAVVQAAPSLESFMVLTGEIEKRADSFPYI